jgi:phosphatidylglycerophosphate synthase
VAAVPAMVVLASVALVLDAVDGQVARRTGTESGLGARFDMEVDAFLILVLSLYVARSMGGWVVAIGAMRYLYVAASWALPWLRRRLPARYWRKVVAAIQGVVLVVAMAAVVPAAAAMAGVAVSLALLVESFGRDIAWQWRHRPAGPVAVFPALASTMDRR